MLIIMRFRRRWFTPRVATQNDPTTPYLMELFGVFESVLDGAPELPMYEEIGSIKR